MVVQVRCEISMYVEDEQTLLLKNIGEIMNIITRGQALFGNVIFPPFFVLYVRGLKEKTGLDTGIQILDTRLNSCPFVTGFIWVTPVICNLGIIRIIYWIG